MQGTTRETINNNPLSDARGRRLGFMRLSLQRDEQSAFSWNRHHSAATAQYERACDAPFSWGRRASTMEHHKRNTASSRFGETYVVKCVHPACDLQSPTASSNATPLAACSASHAVQKMTSNDNHNANGARAANQ